MTSLAGFRRGLVVGVFSLAGLAIGFYLGARVGPSLVGGDLARWLPLVALGGAMVCAAIGQAVGSLAGRHLRRLLVVLGPLRLFDNVGGGVLGAVTGLALCWAVGAVLLYLPAPDRAAPLRPGLGDPLAPQPGGAAASPDRHARADRSVRDPRRAGGGRRGTGSCRARHARA